MAGGERIDKWLWAVRLAATRTFAQELIHAGHVTVNDEKVLKCSRDVKIGDQIRLVRGAMRFHVEVAGLSEKRVGAPVAATLYVHLSEPENTAPKPKRSFEFRDKGTGRPTKRERRAINVLKGKF